MLGVEKVTTGVSPPFREEWNTFTKTINDKIKRHDQRRYVLNN